MPISRSRPSGARPTRARPNPDVRRVRAGLANPKAAQADAAKRAALKDLNVQMQSIALELRKVEAANARIEELKGEVQALMDSLGLKEHEFQELIAKYTDEYTQPRRFVDPQKLYNKLNEKDFFAVVTVAIGKLEEVLSENEINKLAQQPKPQFKGTKFSIERTKAKAGKKK